MDTVCRVSVPVLRNVDLSDHAPVLNLSLARAWLGPSVQLAASAAPPVPAVSNAGFWMTLAAGAGGGGGAWVGGTGGLEGVFVGGAGEMVAVGSLVGLA